jgi:hypothetical protein
MRRYLKGSIGNIARVQIISKDRTKVKLSSILFRQTPKLRDSECYEYVVPTTKCAIMMKPGLNGQKIYEFGQFISAREREWLVEEITNFIDRRK